jgi:hypothetical protein
VKEGVFVHFGTFSALVIFTMVFFFVYIWFREQACIIVCPYGREGTIVEAGSIYAGVPAKKVKAVSEELINGEINRISNNYVKYASWFEGANQAPK